MTHKISLFCLGSLFLIIGITLVLKEWDSVVVVFKGVGGGLLALTGLVILMLSREQKVKA